MKDPYAFGFYSACLALVVLVFAALLSSGPGQAYAALHTASAIIEAVAACFIAAVAFAAYGTWKHEIQKHKASAIIWDANVAFRELEVSFTEWFFGASGERLAATDQTRLDSQLSSSPLGVALRAFKKQCIMIDKIVLKGSWRWVNHATELDLLARELNTELFRPMTKGKVKSGVIDFIFTLEEQPSQKTQAQWESLMDRIERELMALAES